MERKQWLETFLKLADSNAPAISYRKHLRIMINDLGPHVKAIGAYRAELNEILETEKREEKRKADELVKSQKSKKLDSTRKGFTSSDKEDQEDK